MLGGASIRCDLDRARQLVAGDSMVLGMLRKVKQQTWAVFDAAPDGRADSRSLAGADGVVMICRLPSLPRTIPSSSSAEQRQHNGVRLHICV